MIKQLLPFWPQILTLGYFILKAISMILSHGRETKSSDSKFTLFLGTLVSIFVLSKGGYFDYIGGSQIIYIILAFLMFIIIFSSKKLSQENKVVDGSLASIFIHFLINVGLLYWGGFYDGFINFLMTL